VAVYVIVDIDIFDPVGFAEYRKAVVPLVQKYGGQYIAADDGVELLEGDWNPKRIVVIQFPSLQDAKGCLNCEEYSEPCKIGQRTAKTGMIHVKSL